MSVIQSRDAIYLLESNNGIISWRHRQAFESEAKVFSKNRIAHT